MNATITATKHFITGNVKDLDVPFEATYPCYQTAERIVTLMRRKRVRCELITGNLFRWENIKIVPDNSYCGTSVVRVKPCN